MGSPSIISAVDLFCGIGGLTNGLRSAGIDVMAGIDNDPSCAFGYEYNNKVPFIQADIREVDASYIESLYPTESIKLLLSRKTHIRELRQLAETLGNAAYYQFVLQVTKVKHTKKGTVPIKAIVSEDLPPVVLDYSPKHLRRRPAKKRNVFR